MHKEKKQPQVTVGIPVFNGEKFLHKRLDSILAQSFKNFEIIISDNASTDNTCEICKEYVRKDDRVKYNKQNKNIGPLRNFDFLLNQSNTEFFVWAAVDDLWDEKFLSKNIEILQTRKNIVGSFSKVTSYGPNVEIRSDAGKKYLFKKILFPKGPTGIHSITGSYDKKVRFYLKNSSCSLIYSVFRTKKLMEGFVTRSFLGSDWAGNLNMLKLGDIHVIDEELVLKYNQGTSSKSIITLTRFFNKGSLKTVFPWIPFSFWCMKNLGPKIFLNNIDYFLMLNYIGFIAQLKERWSERKRR